MKQIPKNVSLTILRGYKFFVSPALGAACRYQPCCSDYAMHAIEIHGAICGSLMALGRILRCHPFSAGGYDPVRPKHSSLSHPHRIYHTATQLTLTENKFGRLPKS